MVSARVERLRAPTLTIAALATATLALRLRDPHQEGSWGFCPFTLVTGVACPGCGGLRAVNDLTRGDIGSALSSNLVVTLAIPIATAALALWFVSAWRGRPMPRPSARWQIILSAVTAVALVVFALVRNLPVGSVLAP